MFLKKLGTIKILLLTSILCSSSLMAAETGERYELLWRVKPQEVRDAPVWVKEQGVISESVLLPIEVRVNRDDVIGIDGAKLAPAGTQFAKMRPESDLFCALPNKEERGPETPKWLIAKKRLCLAAPDANGTFLSYFLPNSLGYWYSISGVIPNMERLTSPVSLSVISSEEFKNSPVFELHYQRFLDKGNLFQRSLDIGSQQVAGRNESAIRFQIQVGKKKNTDWMVRGCGDSTPPALCVGGTLPSDFVVLGLSGTILERRGEEVLVQLRTSFDNTAVSFVKTGPYTQGAIYEGSSPDS